MILFVTGAKGGVGATVVAAAIGLANDPAGTTTMVDLTGDLQAALSGSNDTTVGLRAWLSSDAATGRLDDLRSATSVAGVALLPWGPATAAEVDPERWALFADWCRHRSRLGDLVVVDAGPHGDLLRRTFRRDDSERGDAGVPIRHVLVTRHCYLALRRARQVLHPAGNEVEPGDGRIDGVVVVAEPGRALRDRDVERALGAPVIASMTWESAISRAVDAGLDTVGPPRSMRRTGQRVRRQLVTGTHTRRLVA